MRVSHGLADPQAQVLLGNQAEDRSPSGWVMTGLLLCPFPLQGASQPEVGVFEARSAGLETSP